MRGRESEQRVLFSYVNIETRIAREHPLRIVKKLVDEVLRQLSPRFDTMYARGGRPSVPPEQLRSEAALTLSPHAKAPDGLIEQRVPAGDYARTVHQGSYEGLPATWNALKNEWLPSSGRRMGHPSYEVYVNNPMTTEKSGLLTEIYLRLE